MEPAPTPFIEIIDTLIWVIEYVGIAVIALAVTASLIWFFRTVAKERSLDPAYRELRSNLGRGILLGLELLVGADIIGTVTSPLSFDTLGMLAIVVGIRTFLSFALETEIEGRWPWRRGASDAQRSAEA